MLRRSLAAAMLAIAASCSPPAQQSAETPARPEPQEIACNTVTPDVAKQISVTEAPAAAAMDLRGGRITPGLYDLASAQRIGGATGWPGTRAIALEVTEDAATGAVTLNWAGTTPTSLMDRWTGTLAEAPQTRLTYTCGRIGEVDADFIAGERALELRLADGADGAMLLSFLQR
ncbi:MAG TPA: hypothetical protein VEA80_18145 [Vitreimonas sp.]|uniref:hypothetical protein n=1 Tax=Vitreimonas sp. TaxID=3069702 RepID=UPI002D3467C8|nr:hypothetical protein [Vitreimonas sp.]HYD89406.1 hypothetical protein [Vitreimonas sp.]